MKKSILIFSLFLTLFSCKKDDTATSIATNVYVAGYEYNNTTYVAKFWKNGAETSLTDGRYNALALTVFVSGNDVYVAGYNYSVVQGINVPCLWRNGVYQQLSNSNGAAYSIYVSNNDVYVAGFTKKAGANMIATVWKNGVETLLADGTQGSDADAVFVSGNDVYVAGSEHYPSTAARLWKNGIFIPLSNSNGYASSIYVSNNDVYLAGGEYNGTKRLAKIWKNGVATLLTNGTQDAFANAVYVAGSDVYIVGSEFNSTNYRVAKLWKNGVAISLSNNTTYSYAFSVCVSNKDVYVAGNYDGTKQLWKNGVATSLISPGNTNLVYATSVFVTTE